MMTSQTPPTQQSVYVQAPAPKQGNAAALTLGIIATVIGSLAFLFSWIPVLGLVAIPFALVGLLLAFIGLVVSLATGFRSIAMPIVAGLICILAMIVPIVITALLAALSETPQ